MANISVALFTHHLRIKRAEKTLEQLQEQGVDDVKLIVDTKDNSIWETAKRGWKSYDSDATHVLLLQDDIVVCNDFLPVVEHIVSIIGNEDALSLCDNIRLMSVAERSGIHLIKSQIVTHAQALVLPVPIVNPFIEWADYYIRPEYYHDDGKLEIFLRKSNRYIWHTVPSLVHHDDKGSVRKLEEWLNNQDTVLKNNPYLEYKFIGDTNPFEIDWQHSYDRHVPCKSNMKPDKKWAINEVNLTIPTSSETGHRILTRDNLAKPYEEVMSEHRARYNLKKPKELT